MRSAVRCGGAIALAVPLCLGAPVPAHAQCPDGSPPPCAGARPARGPATAAPSVAVLYFDNLSRDTTDAYLADGLTEQTIAQLGQVPRLTVASRFAVRRFRGGEQQDPAAVGRSLNVTYLVTGSVQRAGTRLRVGVELVRAGTGVRVWGEQYDRTATDLLTLQDDIASAVATGIVGRLLPAERAGITARTTRDPAAYDQFLRGNFYLAQRTLPSILLAVRAYQAAIAADPSYTDAIARVAYAYANALDNEYDIGLPRDTILARGVAMAERAVRLDSTSSEAWLARAYIRMGETPQTFAGVRPLFERAIALNPRSAEAHHQFASYLLYMGDTAAARAECLRALALEPGRAITWFQRADLAARSRQGRDVLGFADSALAADPQFALAHVQRFTGAMLLGDTATARRGAEGMRATGVYRGYGDLLAAFLDALAGDWDARARFVAVVAAQPQSPTATGNVIGGAYAAALFAQLGDHDVAMQLLSAARPRGARLHDMMRLPLLDPLRADPRFAALFEETRAPGSLW